MRALLSIVKELALVGTLVLTATGSASAHHSADSSAVRGFPPVAGPAAPIAPGGLVKCNAQKRITTTKASHAFSTTAGVVKSRRVGPSPSPAAAAWASVPNAQVAYWCETTTGQSYSVFAITGTRKPIQFVTSNLSVLTGPEGPLIP